MSRLGVVGINNGDYSETSTAGKTPKLTNIDDVFKVSMVHAERDDLVSTTSELD